MSSPWALPCPLPGVSDPLGGADALPSPSSPGGITAADLVKPRATRPRAAGWLGDGVLVLMPCLLCRPLQPLAPLGLAWGGEPWQPSLHRSLARGRGTAVCRGLAGVPLPPPPPPTLAGLPTSCLPAPLHALGVDAPLLLTAATPLWPPHPLPVPGRWRRRGGWGRGPLPRPPGTGG